jgi:hypothetical protein
MNDSDSESDIQLDDGSDEDNIVRITAIENARKFAKITGHDREKVEQEIHARADAAPQKKRGKYNHGEAWHSLLHARLYWV